MVSTIADAPSVLYYFNDVIHHWQKFSHHRFVNNEFKSKQLYPPGSTPVCVIEFYLPEAAVVSLSLLNEQGRIFKKVLEKVKYDPGRHEIEVDRGSYADGICFYRLSMQTDRKEIVDTKRLVLQPDSN